jgi:hypothetical protein
MTELREPDCLDHWRHRPGSVPDWVRVAIALGCALTLVIAFVGPRLVLRLSDAHAAIDPFWFRNSLAIVAAAGLVLAALPGGALSRYLRMAVWLPIIHALVIVAAWFAWAAFADRLTIAARASAVVTRLSPGATFGAAVLLVGAAAAWAASGRKRRAERVHAFVLASLVALLGFGLWAPIITCIWEDGHAYIFSAETFEASVGHPLVLAFVVFVPPLGAAAAYARLVLAAPAAMARARGALVITAAVLLCAAVASLTRRTDSADYAYAGLMVPLLALAAVAVGALLALAVATWLRGRHAQRAFAHDGGGLTGTLVAVEDDAEPTIARVAITSWLRGPAAMTDAFAIRTPAGEVLVPGAHLIAPLSPVTTQLQTGEAMPVLRVGDRVVLTGLDTETADHPFRASALPVAGTRELYVGPPGAARVGLADIGLTLWRPCVAYLVILVLVGIPTLAAAFIIH